MDRFKLAAAAPMGLILLGLAAFIIGCVADDLQQHVTAHILCAGGVGLCACGIELLRLRMG